MGRAADRPNPIYQSPVWRLIETSTHDWKPSFCSSQPLARRRCSAGAKKEMGLTGELAIYHNLGVNIGTSRRRRSWRTLPSPKNLSGQSASTVYQSSRRLVLDLVPGVRHDSGHILESFRNRCTAASEIPLESRGLGCAEGPLPPEPKSSRCRLTPRAARLCSVQPAARSGKPCRMGEPSVCTRSSTGQNSLTGVLFLYDTVPGRPSARRCRRTNAHT